MCTLDELKKVRKYFTVHLRLQVLQVKQNVIVIFFRVDINSFSGSIQVYLLMYVVCMACVVAPPIFSLYRKISNLSLVVFTSVTLSIQ